MTTADQTGLRQIAREKGTKPPKPPRMGRGAVPPGGDAPGSALTASHNRDGGRAVARDGRPREDLERDVGPEALVAAKELFVQVRVNQKSASGDDPSQADEE